MPFTHEIRLKRLGFRAWHRGTMEADLLLGGFFDARVGQWGESELAWFEALLTEDDPHIMDWAFGHAEPPARYQGPMLTDLRTLDFVAARR